ncbi:MAG: hypothetical protein R3B72_19280 [Polyangiaceae bacterium]
MTTSRALLAAAFVLTACNPGRSTPSPTSASGLPSAPPPTTRTIVAPDESDAPKQDEVPEVRVHFGEAPDDGPAYVITIGDRRQTPDADGNSCSLDPETDGLHIALGFKGFQPRYVVGDQLLFELVPGQDIIEAWACRRGERCVGFSHGLVELDRLEPLVGASGRYRLEPKGGGPAREGRFEATWCRDRFDDRAGSVPRFPER